MKTSAEIIDLVQEAAAEPSLPDLASAGALYLLGPESYDRFANNGEGEAVARAVITDLLAGAGEDPLALLAGLGKAIIQSGRYDVDPEYLLGCALFGAGLLAEERGR